MARGGDIGYEVLDEEEMTLTLAMVRGRDAELQGIG